MNKLQVAALILVLAGNMCIAQDVFISDSIPVLRIARENFGSRELVRLGEGNKYVVKGSVSRTPYNTTLMVYDPLLQSPEGCDVKAYMLAPVIPAPKPETFWQRAGRTLHNMFRK